MGCLHSKNTRTSTVGPCPVEDMNDDVSYRKKKCDPCDHFLVITSTKSTQTRKSFLKKAHKRHRAAEKASNSNETSQIVANTPPEKELENSLKEKEGLGTAIKADGVIPKEKISKVERMKMKKRKFLDQIGEERLAKLERQRQIREAEILLNGTPVVKVGSVVDKSTNWMKNIQDRVKAKR